MSRETVNDLGFVCVDVCTRVDLWQDLMLFCAEPLSGVGLSWINNDDCKTPVGGSKPQF